MDKSKAITILTAHVASMKNCLRAPVTFNDGTIKALEMAVDALKRDIEDRCKMAEINSDGKCRGYQKSRVNDEPSEKCKECENFELYEV